MKQKIDTCAIGWNKAERFMTNKGNRKLKKKKQKTMLPKVKWQPLQKKEGIPP